MFDKISPPEIKEEVRIDKEPENKEELKIIEESNTAAEVVEEAPEPDQHAEEIFENPEPEPVEEEVPEPIADAPAEPDPMPSFDMVDLDKTLDEVGRPSETDLSQGILSRDYDQKNLNILQTGETAPYLVKVTKAQKLSDGAILLTYEGTDLKPLENLLKGPIGEDQIKNILKGLCDLVKSVYGIKHLYTNRVLVDEKTYTFKVLAGDSWTFQEPELTGFDFTNLHAASKNDPIKVNNLTPEVVDKILSKGIQGNESRFRKLQDAQVWWDMGIILYRASTGFLPFQNTRDGVVLKLIQRYPVSFPCNMPETSDGLKDVIRELFAKKRKHRLGHADAGGVADILANPYLN